MANLIENLLNVGVEILNQRKEEETISTSVEDNTKDNKPYEEAKGMSYEETCENDLKVAKEQNKEEPDFDFRNLYEKGDIVYYILKTETFVKRKELVKLKLRTIYPRMMVGVEDNNAGCHCIGFKQKDMVFINLIDANAYYDALGDYAEEETTIEEKESI
jgi:hypothetical protein